MKENRGKEVMDKGSRPDHPSTGDKRKTLSKNLDLGNLPNCRGKKAKHRSSKAGVVKPNPPTPQLSVQIFDVDSSTLVEVILSKTIVPTSSQPSQRIPMKLIENEDLAWGHFEKAVSDEDTAACYDMSLKDFKHSGVHDLFKDNFIFASSLLLYTFSCLTIIFVIYFFIANVKFIAMSRQATELDKTRILLETRVQEVKDKCKRWAEVAAKAKNEAKELQNHVEELRTDIIEKDTHLNHLQKRNDELSTLLEKAKGDVVVEFKASEQFTDLMDTNYAAEFEDFWMDAIENFPEVDFSSIKLNLGGAATSSLLQTSSEDVNIEDDATTQPNQDDPNAYAPPPPK